MQTKLLALRQFFEGSFETDTIPSRELNLVLNLAPKKFDNQYVISNNSFEILCLLMKVDIRSKCNYPDVTNYLIDVSRNIFNFKVINQYYQNSRVSAKLELLEFDVINKINSYLVELLNVGRRKPADAIMSLINEVYLPRFKKVASLLSTNNTGIEQNLDKNDVLWLRSLLRLPMRNQLLDMFATEEVTSAIREQLEIMMQIPVNEQPHDGFYKTGVVLHMFRALNPDMNMLQFLSNYTSMLIKRYLKLEEINQKLLNPFRLALETCVSYQENSEGYMLETNKNLSLKRLLEQCLGDLNGISEDFYVKFISDVLKSIEIVFARIPSMQEKVRVVDILFNYYMKCKSHSESIERILLDNRHPMVVSGNSNHTLSVPPPNVGNLNTSQQSNGKLQSPRKTKEEALARIKTVSELVLQSMFHILAQEDFDAALMDYNNSLVYNFIVHVFNSLSAGNLRTDAGSQILDVDQDQVQMTKDPRKLELFGFKFMYNLVKKFHSTRMNELVYNLISSKYSMKVSLNELKHYINSLEEKKAQKTCPLTFYQLIVKMKLQMSLNISDSKLFQKSMNELMTFYTEIIEDSKYRQQEELAYLFIKKLIRKTNNEEKLLIMFNQLTAFMIRLAKEVVFETRNELFLVYFAKYLDAIRDILKKTVVKANSSLPRDAKFIERLIEVWIYIMFHKKILFDKSEVIIHEIALLTPRLLQSSATSYTNSFLINAALNNQRIIDKYRRSMKHILRDKIPELRAKVRNLTLGEMMFLLAIDYILDAKIKEVTRNPRKILEVKKDIPIVEIILCYVRDIYINEKENLKEVLEELLVRKARFYISQLILVHQEKLQIAFAEKDFVTILQSACSINKIYMRISQTLLKEFIREFPKLVFQELIIATLCELLEFLNRKILFQYDSVSERLKVSHYNLKIAIPNTLKDINDLFVFLLACLHAMALRGHIIEGATLLKRLEDVGGMPQFNDLKHGLKIFKYFLWTLNNHLTLTTDTTFKGAGYWFYDKLYFQGKVEKFENKHLEEGLKVLSVIPISSFELNFDAKAVINTLHHTLKEFKSYESDQAGITALKEEAPSFQKIYESLKSSLVHFYIYVLIQREKNYKVHIGEILKDPIIYKIFERESKEIIASSSSKPGSIFDKVTSKMNEAYSQILTYLQLTVSFIKVYPEQAFQTLRKVYALILCLPIRKVLKYVVKTVTKNILTSIPSRYTPPVVRALFFLLQEIIFKYNTYTSITAVTKLRQFSFDLLEVNSELFVRIKFKDLFGSGSLPPELRDVLNKNFITCKDRDDLQVRAIRSLFAIKHFKDTFTSIHRDVMSFIHSHLSIFLINHVQPFDLLMFLHENFEILKPNIEHLQGENISTTIAAHLAVLNILKNRPLNDIQRRFLQKFYHGTLKFGLSYFSKNNKYYVDACFESESCVAKIEKKIDLGLRACKYLKYETFMETAQTSEKVDVSIKFPQVFLDLNVVTPNKTKLLFKFQDCRTKWFYDKLTSSLVGSLGLSRKRRNIEVIYDPSNEKKQILTNTTGVSRFQNLRKLLLTLMGHEIDTIKAFNKTELGHLRYEFTLEDRILSDSEARNMIYHALEININLVIYIIRRLGSSLPVVLTTSPGFVRDLVTKYHLFHFPYQITFDYFVEKNMQNISMLQNIFYWDAPQFPLLMKYMTLEYEGQRTLQIYFTKTMKRLESTQLLFYLPQIYQSLNTNAGYLVAQTLKEYSQTSYLFSHQLIWKAKVESKREKNEAGNSKLQYISVQLLYQLLKGLSKTEKFLFNQVDGFFESITAISGILNPKSAKKKKEETVKVELQKIHVNEYLYVPCSPQYMIDKIKLDSGRAMQSAAKCPILVSFYCKRFEGPDKYYNKLMNKHKLENIEQDHVDAEIIPEIDEVPSINDLKVSSNVKLFPKDSLNNSEQNSAQTNDHLERISEKDEDASPEDIQLGIKDDDEINKSNVSESKLAPKSLNKNTKKGISFGFDKSHKVVFNDEEEKEGRRDDPDPDLSRNLRLEVSLGTSNYMPGSEPAQREEFPLLNDRFKPGKSTIGGTNLDQLQTQALASPGVEQPRPNAEPEEAKTEIISCIFKVFDDIRQDDLALQVINLFKHIFQSVGLDLFLFPYRTISNRTGKDLDIGGIIEVVPNTISRDQMGKMMDCNLYEYFIARFGNEMSPEFQLARENFIKSMAAYSIVSYFLQIKDRHNGNILIDAYGHIVHIDFGFIFDISPAHNLKFESANFKLTKEMIQIMGGSQTTEPFNYFVDQTTKAFLAIRRFDEQVFNMIKLMTYSGLKCFRPMSLQNLRERFMPRMNELQAATMMRKIILDAYNKLTTNLYDDIQRFQNKIHR